MKKLIALFAVSTLASTSAIAGIALSGAASVSYDDNGSAGGAASDGASATTYDADITLVGTAGATTFTYSMDVDRANPATTAADMSTTIGPVTIAADMFDVVETTLNDGDGDPKAQSDDTGVTISLDAPIGDATVGLDNSGNVTVSGTWSGITVSHTSKKAGDTTTAAGSIAGMDISVTNKAGATTWSLGTTVSGVDLTLNSKQAITAAFGLTGNTMTVSHISAVDAATSTATTYSVSAVKAYSTVAISRDLTSGAALSATYSSHDDSLTLKASVAF
ncbi:hypothetical protein OAY03_00645 [Candidatus Thioglobus sp.]|nr:hypothetical protein [Candidatus Thioglobus sp.]